MQQASQQAARNLLQASAESRWKNILPPVENAATPQWAKQKSLEETADEKVSLELSFHHWIGQVFVPSAKAAIKKKKMKAVADLMAKKK